MNQALIVRIATCLTLSLFLAADEGRSQTAQKQYVIVGYLGSRDWTHEAVEAEKLTIINYAFAVPAASGELASLRERDIANLMALHGLKSNNPALKILISIGGWGGCRYFSDASLTETSRARFANSAMALVKLHDLDGVDIDWEYPGQVGANNIFRPEDKQNYTLLLKTLRQKLDELATSTGRAATNRYLLTTATGADAEFTRHTELDKAQVYLDYVNIMTYDIYNGNDRVTGHHSTLHQSSKGKHARISSDEAVKLQIDAGVPAGKIVLGVPFYARGWNDVDDQDDGLFQSSGEKPFGVSHDKLLEEYINKNGYVRHWDDEAKEPFLWNAQSRTFISYDDPESLACKVDFVKSEGLAGIMFWEYSEDMKHNELLDAVYQDLRK